eukprot:jgi/Botrbrau1/7051/Bobra.0165s0074.1
MGAAEALLILQQDQAKTEKRVEALEDFMKNLTVSSGNSSDPRVESALLELRTTLLKLQDEYKKAAAERAALELKASEQAYQIEILKASVRKGDEDLRTALMGSEAERSGLCAKYAHRLRASGAATTA